MPASSGLQHACLSHQQLTALPGAGVSLRLEIDAEVPSGLDRAKVRTLLENANTLGFIDKAVK